MNGKTRNWLRLSGEGLRTLAGTLALLGIAIAAGGCSRSEPLETIREQHAEGKYQATIGSLRELVDANPTESGANLLLGLALLRTGEAGSAIWPLRVAVKDPELAIEAGLALTEASLESRYKDEAIQAVNAVLSLDPDNLPALEMRVAAYQESGRNEEAIAEIERVLELDPTNKKVLVPRIIAYLAMEKEEEAEEALAQAQTALEPSPEKTAPEPMLDSSRAKLCVVTGMFTFERGDPEGADQQYAKCVETYPVDRLVVRESIRYYDGTGRRDRATEILKEAFAKEPTRPFLTMMAERMEMLGDIEETERLLRVEAQERNSSNAWFVLGDHFVKRDMFDQAVEAFQKAVDAEPDVSPMIRFAHADTLIQAGEYERARKAATKLEGTALGDLIEGRVLAAEGKLEEALVSFEAGIGLWPNNPGARFLAGQTAEQLGRFEEAASHYREAIRADKSQNEAALRLASLQEASGEYIQALERIGHYVRSHPVDPQGYIATIRLAQILGQHEIVKQGLVRLARLPGQQGVALSVSANLVSQRAGPEGSIKLITNSPVDLTDPANEMALDVLVGNLLKLDRAKAAEKYVLAALKAHPESADFHALHGYLMQRRGAAILARRGAFQRSIQLDESQATALTGLAMLEVEEENYDRAIELYDRASRADPEQAGPAIAALRLLRKHAPLEEQEARGREFLLRHLHSAILASELAQIVATRGKDPAGALGFARRSARFDRGAHAISIRAFEAVAEMASESASAEARSALEQLRAEKS